MFRNAAALSAALLALPAVAAVSEPSGLEPGLRASAAEAPALMLSANGVQIFECRQSPTDANVYSWSFVGPDATLYEGSRSVGRHATANHWESTSDRTSVSGVPRATQSAGGNNLPWLAFRAIPAGEGGMFEGVTSIQRVNTTGGVAPLTGCGATSVGSETRVPFTADFYFYKRRG
jgi:hypothetical protein